MSVTLGAGDPAPTFELPDQDGEVHRLADYQGQTVVLYFYPRDFTPGCTKQACSLRDTHQAIADEGAVVLGVSTDDAESHRRFREEHGLRFPLLVMTLLSGAVLGSLAVLGAYPLFVFRELRLAVVVITVNGVLALVVGGVVLGYEEMRLRLQETLREMEEVRLVEARLREEAARAELAALQARINPHFFFNTLNTITAMLEEDVRKAEELLETFASLFRYTFEAADAAPVPLRDEIAFTRGYLRIEHARFGERLQVAWDVDPRSLPVRVPGLILQPLIENAVGHGLAPRARGGRIDVSTAVDGATLRIEVADDGVGLAGAEAPLVRDGHGLGNIARRLDACYGRHATLDLRPAPDGAGTRARLVLPAGTGAPAGAGTPAGTGTPAAGPPPGTGPAAAATRTAGATGPAAADRLAPAESGA